MVELVRTLSQDLTPANKGEGGEVAIVRCDWTKRIIFFVLGIEYGDFIFWFIDYPCPGQKVILDL